MGTATVRHALFITGIAGTTLLLARLSNSAQAAGTETAHAGPKDTVIAEDAVQPSWIAWKLPAMPNADMVYTDRARWDLCVMDEYGRNRRCLTGYGNNVLGVNFPLDQKNRIRWKGDPIVHPTLPIILFKAENDHSEHRPLTSSPGIGWDNDFWALNLREKTYTRLTQIDKGQGLQCAAISPDGKWLVYPLRYAKGDPREGYGLSRMVFCELAVDRAGSLSFTRRFEAEPNGPMYYEPNEIIKNASGSYSLLYAADASKCTDPYMFEWTWDGRTSKSTNKLLLRTPSVHEEFFTYSPARRKIAWMKGTLYLGRYFADLYFSDLDFQHTQRMTWYNDSGVHKGAYSSHGCQLGRITWKHDGSAIFFGLWIHGGPLKPFNKAEIHRLDLAPPTADATGPGATAPQQRR